MLNKKFLLIFSLLFLSTLAFAEETKTQTKKHVEEKKQKEQAKQKPQEKKKVDHKKSTQNKSTKKKTSKKKPTYYPKAKKPVILGQEKYQKTNKSLKGLKAVYINLEGYLKGSKSRNMKMAFDVKKKVAGILKKHNIKLLDKYAVKWKYGQPTINISASFPAFLGPYKKGEKKKKYDNCCSASVSASLTEGARLLRYPDLNLQLTTWKASERTTDCAKLNDWFPKAVIKVVEKLVMDKAKAENKVIAKKVVKKVVAKKPIVKKPTVKKPEVKKVVKKTVEKKQVVKATPNYASRGSLANTTPIKKTVVTKKTVVKKTNKGQSYPKRTYQRVPVAPVVATVATVAAVAPLMSTKAVEKEVAVQKFTPVVTQPVVTKQELVCSNGTSEAFGGEELYRKVVTYERVASRQQVVNYEVVSPQMGCEQSVTMDMEIFRTGSSRVDPSKRFILDTFVSKIEACPNYKYVIETHADPRGSHAYNDRLTKNRATSIARYLERKGVPSSRFETQSFGKRKPINFGTSAEDYSKNRRVVMIPHKIKTK